MPEGFIRKEVTIWSGLFALAGAVAGYMLKGQSFTKLTPGLAIALGLGLAIGFVIGKFLRFRIGPHWWIPYLVWIVVAEIFYRLL